MPVALVGDLADAATTARDGPPLGPPPPGPPLLAPWPWAGTGAAALPDRSSLLTSVAPSRAPSVRSFSTAEIRFRIRACESVARAAVTAAAAANERGWLPSKP